LNENFSRKWATPTQSCSPIAVFLVSKQCKRRGRFCAISYSLKIKEYLLLGIFLFAYITENFYGFVAGHEKKTKEPSLLFGIFLIKSK
jgi:hypothetical protein